METPDGKVFKKGRDEKRVNTPSPAPHSRAHHLAQRSARAVARLVRAALRVFWGALVLAARGLAKLWLTTWRLASALDSALWRALKLLAARLWDGAMHGAALAGQVIHSLVLWLPTRTGRAYSAVSGIGLVIAGLWIADELRAGMKAEDAATFATRPPVDLQDPILARIGGRYIHLSEIIASARASGIIGETETLTPDSAFARGLVDLYVEQRLLARAAQDDGLHRTPLVLRRINAARDRILAATLIQSRLAETVTPETVERFYLSQRQITRLGDEVRARHILVASEAEAQEILHALRDGADFSALARARSLDRATAPLGGEIGWFSRAMMERRFADAAFSAEPGSIATPFETEFGWNILEIVDRRSTGAKPFDAVSEDIEEFLRLRLISDTLESLSDDNRVVYYRPERSGRETDATPPDLTTFTPEDDPEIPAPAARDADPD